jgi:hypothetical protein
MREKWLKYEMKMAGKKDITFILMENLLMER